MGKFIGCVRGNWMIELKIKKIEMPVILWCMGIFLFPCIMRNSILGSLGSINFLVYIGVLMAYDRHILYSPFSFSKHNFWKRCGLVFSILCLILLLFYSRGNGWGIDGKIRLIFLYIFPTLFIYMNFANASTIERYCLKWFACLKLVCRILCLAGIADILLENIIQRFFAYIYASDTLYALINSGRFVSYYGHSLNNTLFFLLLLSWTTVIKNIYSNNKKDYLLDVAVSLFGIAITGSKSGIMLALLLLLLCNVGLKNAKYLIAIIILFLVLYFTGIFDTVIDRIMQGIAIGDLSTSRNTALDRLLKNGILRFDLFRGHLIDYSGTSMIAALEYPFLRWSYTVGIVFACVLYGIDFIIPALRVVVSRKWCCLICILIVMAFVNGNNGISAYNDDMLIYAINIGLMMQAALRGRIESNEEN